MDSPPFTLLPPLHPDLIQAISYNDQSTILATGGVDQTIRLFSNTVTPPSLLTQWKAHDAPILRLQFLPAGFGTALVSTALDRTLKLWEFPGKSGGFALGPAAQAAAVAAGEKTARWKCQYIFTPQSPGLYVADFTISAPPNLRMTLLLNNGTLHILESTEPFNFSAWLVSSEHSEPLQVVPGAANDAEETYCLSETRNGRLGGQFLFAGVGINGRVYRWGEDTWRRVGRWESPSPMRDIRVAPSAGRPWHLIATACRDGKVRLLKLVPRVKVNKETTVVSRGLAIREILGFGMAGGYSAQDSGLRIDDDEDEAQEGLVQLETVAELEACSGEVWRVEWNATATLLSTAGDDGKVRIWKCGADGRWRCTSLIETKDEGDV